MKYFTATLQSAADIIRLIVIGTAMRAAMILALIASDVGFWLIVSAWFAAQIW